MQRLNPKLIIVCSIIADHRQALVPRSSTRSAPRRLPGRARAFVGRRRRRIHISPPRGRSITRASIAPTSNRSYGPKTTPPAPTRTCVDDALAPRSLHAVLAVLLHPTTIMSTAPSQPALRASPTPTPDPSAAPAPPSFLVFALTLGGVLLLVAVARIVRHRARARRVARLAQTTSSIHPRVARAALGHVKLTRTISMPDGSRGVVAVPKRAAVRVADAMGYVGRPDPRMLDEVDDEERWGQPAGGVDARSLRVPEAVARREIRVDVGG
ncbi:hypothetical protein AMAG_15241 [Allomyces macrogynus ATCC 38327]|uniref:Uncharacterized protein n=1 Tax=Allomyces macrogynus (strain ATCC 38327) TaxID=578462 RepID=A0A0L0T8G2_ALLM3|nr:hypothetical protein AMAG_15241 [Allomyces macrogynus ATCC 38327]|eukprot:KNE70981.1 hypothetical protein AMAG_15241 [Allomyces macrogynus ATCC 38327]